MIPDDPPGIWAPMPAEVSPEIRGSGSHLAKSHYELTQTSQEMPDWQWLVGGDGFRPESGRPYLYRHNRGCDSTNRTCYCHWHINRYIGGACDCPTHKDQPPLEETA